MFMPLLIICFQDAGDVGSRDRDGRNVDKRWLYC